jgi:DNA-binding PadR family transcriptional regulator
MAKRRKVGNLLALGLLALLVPGGPMHPYEMATVLRRTGKEQDLRIKWGSLYTVVANLEKHGFIAAVDTARSGRRPERTRYAITGAGRAELTDWVRELLAEPEPEQSRLRAALSVAGALPPDEVRALLQTRVRTLADQIEQQRAALAHEAGEVPRLFLIEAEYALAMLIAEAEWTNGLLAEFTDGTLPGLAEWRQWHATGETPPEWLAKLKEAEQ